VTSEELDLLADLVADRLAARAVERRWLSVSQASAEWGCSEDAVRLRARRGTVESMHEGRRVLVRRGLG
jgi:hypothetical protein